MLRKEDFMEIQALAKAGAASTGATSRPRSECTRRR